MRTTLDIDEDVLNAAKELAAKENKTAGMILSEVFRRMMNEASPAGARSALNSGYPLKNRVPVVPSRGEIITNERVRQLMEEEGI